MILITLCGYLCSTHYISKSLYIKRTSLQLHLPNTTEDVPVATEKVQSNEIRIGPITRARAKLLEQQVNLFLHETDVLINENFIVPKSLCYCMLRYIGEEGVAQSEELNHMEHNMMITQGCAGEEREEGAREDHQEGGQIHCQD
uniref:Uncharacterized protein n=1 Tax=Avena sativa TaxID=4498 RepID=A0ACD5YJ17_AVESA